MKKLYAISSSPLTFQNTDTYNGHEHFYVITLAAGTVTLPSAVGFRDVTLYFKKRNASAGTITISPILSQTINNSASYSLTADNQYVAIISDDQNWHVVANN